MDERVGASLATMSHQLEIANRACHDTVNSVEAIGSELQARLDVLAQFIELLASDPTRLVNGRVATVEDIWACFRLLLRREPSSTEWTGHSSRAGLPLDDVVTGFLTSLEF